MGLLWSRSKGKKTHLEELEEIDKEISTLVDIGQVTLQKKQRIVARLIIYSILLYVLAAAVVYFCFFPTTLHDGMIYALPLFIFPVFVALIKTLLTWHFENAIKSNQGKLVSLRGKKKKILDEVMENETFKVAKEILEKFAPDQLSKSMKEEQMRKGGKLSEQIQRKTDLGVLGDAGAGRPLQPNLRGQPLGQALSNMAQQRLLNPNQLQTRPLIRPVLPQNRGFIDRFVEALIGDGPNNRYALICTNCATHNGMALKEEFEFIAFRCVYCGFPNPARKRKPKAPSLSESEGALVSANTSKESGDESHIEDEQLPEEHDGEGEESQVVDSDSGESFEKERESGSPSSAANSSQGLKGQENSNLKRRERW